MAVPAKPDAGLMGADVALKAKISVIIVPRAVRVKNRGARRVNPRIGAPDAVAVAVTSGAAAGRRIALVARGAVFDVVFGGPTVIGQPSGRGMQQRHPIFAFMAADTERLPFVTTGAIDLLASGIKPMIEGVIQFMDVPSGIIPAVTVDAEPLLPMTSLTPGAVGRRPFGMRVPPPDGMNVAQSDPIAVAKIAPVADGNSIVTIQADVHGRHIAGPRLGAVPDPIVTTDTGGPSFDMHLMIEPDRSFRIEGS